MSRRASPGDEAGVAGVEQPTPEPAQQDLQAIAEADEERDVYAAPQQPGEEAAQLPVPDVGDGLRFPMMAIEPLSR